MGTRISQIKKNENLRLQIDGAAAIRVYQCESVALHLFEVEPQIKETGTDRMNKRRINPVHPVNPVKIGPTTRFSICF